MLIYLLPLLTGIVAIYLRNPRIERLAFIAGGIILFIRDGVGYDYDNYKKIFEADVKFPFSPLADQLQDLARAWAVPNGFMGLTALLCTVILIALHKFGRGPRMSAALFFGVPFFFLDSFTLVRQTLAVVLAAASYQFLREGRSSYSFGAYLTSIFVHPSAAISLPFFFAINMKLSWKHLLLLPIVLAISVVLILRFQGSHLSQIYQEVAISGNYYLIVTGGLLVIALIFQKREMIISSVIGFLVAIILQRYGNYVLNREIVYFFVPFLFFNAHAHRTTSGPRLLLATAILAGLFIAALNVKISDPSNGFIPYETIL